MPSLSEIPHDVNEAQWRAITHQGSHLLIVAGPGTGKTHTLTHRIIRFAEQLKNSQRILAITFTNKAAREMSERLSGCLSVVNAGVMVDTFHSFCLKFLRQFIRHANLPVDFRVAIPEEIEVLAKELWPDKSVKERKDTVEQISRWKSTSFEQPLPENLRVYNELLRAKGLLDFDDLLLESLNLLTKISQVREQIRNTYRFIFVDEYQDMNPAQHALLKIFVDDGALLTAIGDPNQAIYSFRGADVRFFESFSADFPGAVIMELSENYRSATNLLKASGQVIAKNKRFFIPALNPKILTEGRLTIYEAPTDKAEAEYVVHQLEKLIGGTSMFSIDSGRVANYEEPNASFNDIVILYRLNSQRRVLEEALGRSGIPYRVSGDKPFYQIVLPLKDDPHEENNQKVSLMTLHAAKGLEFPVVFIIGCEENLIPLNLKGFSFDAEEERRLFYVGMTRAKEKLYLIRARRRYLYGQSYENLPSPFLSDIEEELKAYEEIQKKAPKKKFPQEKQMDLFG